MNGILNENIIFREYEIDNPLFQKIDSLIDNSIRDCNYKYFHTLDHICEYDIQLTNITNNESVNFTKSGKSMGMYELNKKLTIARENGFIFTQINKLTKKTYSILSHINIHYHLRLGAPPMHRQFFIKVSKKKNIFNLIAMTVEIHFISHVANGIHIIIHNVI